jgi:hypothetical protein
MSDDTQAPVPMNGIKAATLKAAAAAAAVVTPAVVTPTPAPAPAPAPAPSPVMVSTVYGRMVDPLSMQSYDRTPSELLKRTGWIDSQIAAGKMVVVG